MRAREAQQMLLKNVALKNMKKCLSRYCRSCLEPRLVRMTDENEKLKSEIVKWKNGNR